MKELTKAQRGEEEENRKLIEHKKDQGGSRRIKEDQEGSRRIKKDQGGSRRIKKDQFHNFLTPMEPNERHQHPLRQLLAHDMICKRSSMQVY